MTLSIVLLSIGCSSDDDNQTITDPIVGIWQPIKVVEVCSESPDYIYDYTICEQNGRLTINSDGNFSESSFVSLAGLSCTEDFTQNGAWIIDNGNLEVTINGQIIDVTFFEFTDNNLKLGQFDNDLGCVGESSHYYTEYIRVK